MGVGATARKIPKNYFDEIFRRKDIVVAALIRKTQLRLIDSNEQSNELSNELGRISADLEKALSNEDSPGITEDIKNNASFYCVRKFDQPIYNSTKLVLRQHAGQER